LCGLLAGSPSLISHYAWGGRLCLHPFNLGFRRALLRDNEIPNLKNVPLSQRDRSLSIQIRDWAREQSIPSQSRI